MVHMITKSMYMTTITSFLEHLYYGCDLVSVANEKECMVLSESHGDKWIALTTLQSIINYDLSNLQSL